jgi:molecular chaperone DnaK (HSP70)
LGGEDFDQRVMQHFMKIFQKKHGKDRSLRPPRADISDIVGITMKNM